MNGRAIAWLANGGQLIPASASTLRERFDRNAIGFFAKINLLGLGLLGFWTAINTTLLPDRVADTAPASLAGSALGLISLLGVGFAALVQPVAGRLSDAWPRDDPRRPYIVAGALLCVPGLIFFGIASNFAVLLLGFVLLQLATNIAQAAFQALIPDLVKEEQRGLASGIKNALTVLGAAVGLLGAQGIDALTGSRALVLLWLGLLLVGTGLLTARWTPKRPAPGPEKEPASVRSALNVRAMLKEFRQTLRDHRAFRLGVTAQFLFMLGSYPAQRFLLLFLRDRFGDGAEQRASIGVAVAIVLATIGAAGAGALSDAVGRKTVLIASVLIGGVGLLAIGFSPTISLVALAGGLIAIGLGAFQSVNWALMNDDLPPGQAASSLGVANIATAGAGAAAGLFGPLVDGMNAVFPQGTYQTLFGLAGLVALLSLLPLRRLEEGQEQ